MPETYAVFFLFQHNAVFGALYRYPWRSGSGVWGGGRIEKVSTDCLLFVIIHLRLLLFILALLTISCLVIHSQVLFHGSHCFPCTDGDQQALNSCMQVEIKSFIIDCICAVKQWLRMNSWPKGMSYMFSPTIVKLRTIPLFSGLVMEVELADTLYLRVFYSAGIRWDKSTGLL